MRLRTSSWLQLNPLSPRVRPREMGFLGTKIGLFKPSQQGWRLKCLSATQIKRSPSFWRLYTTSTDATVDAKPASKSEIEKPLDSSEPRKRRLVPWTSEEIQKAHRLIDDGLNRHAVAASLPGRTYKSLQRTIHVEAHNPPAKRGSQAWHPEEIQKLLDLNNSGLSNKEIYSNFPTRTPGSVANMLKYARASPEYLERRASSGLKRLPVKPWSAKEVALLCSLAKEGLSSGQVADKLDRSMRSVLRYYHNMHSLPWPSLTQWTPQETEDLLRMRTSGTELPEIAKIMHRSLDTVTERWKLIRPRHMDGTARTSDSFVVKLSDADWDHVAQMRKSGASWDAVQQSRWPDHPVAQVRDAFKRACSERTTATMLRASSVIPRVRSKSSEAGLDQVWKMIEERDTWAMIACTLVREWASRHAHPRSVKGNSSQ